MIEVEVGDCWLYTGRLNPNGYGRVSRGYVHRVTWEDLVGPIPEGMHLDHLCQVRHCVNPDHLEVVTPSENARRQGRHGPIRGTHCKRGHRYDRTGTGGKQYCSTCYADGQRRRKNG